MENTKRRRSGRLGRLITAVFALAFVVSIISTVTAFAAANLFKIQNAELSELSTTAEGSISSFDETNIVSNVTFHKLHDSAKYTITLKNTDSKDHVIESITDDNESPYISYIYDQHANEQINAGENLVFEVTAKYTTAITDINQRAQATNVRFFIHFTDLEEEIPIVPNTGTNPNTGDYIHFSVISLVISAAGLTIIGIIALKKHKKASKFIAAGIVTVAAIATTATVKAATVEINSFTINTNFALKSKLVVTYEDGEGNSHEVVVDYNEPTTIEDQQKDGYTFTGWEDENGNPVDLSQPITDDITIKPVFTKNGYSIVFDENQGEGSMANLSMVYDEAKQLTKNTFTRTGYTFTSWNTDAEGNGTGYTDEQEVSNLTKEKDGSVTLYAQWSPIHYTINFNGNGATEGSMSSISAEYDKDAQLPAGGFTRTGYTQNGWKNGANSIADQATVKNLASTEGATVTLDAVWEANPYTIHFDANAPSQSTPQGSMSDITAHYDTPETLSYNMFTILGYAFDSWNTKADGSGTKIVNGAEVRNLATDGTVNLYAQWAVTPYTVVFHKNADDATGDMESQQIAYNQPADLNELGYSRTGYNFANWATNADGSGDTFADKQRVINLDIDGTVDLYAQWTPKEYTISFNINTDDPEATGAMSDQTIVYGTQTSLNELDFTRTGYAFDSWNTEADGSGTKYENKQDVSNTISDTDITLYAQWAATPYTIIFDKNNSSATGNMEKMSVQYGVEVNLSENTFVVDEYDTYKFVGWNTMPDGSGAHYDDKQLVKNLDTDGEITLYAEWKLINAFFGSVKPAMNSITSEHPEITTFKKYTLGKPSDSLLENAVDVGESSGEPIYLFNNGEYLYWWSEVKHPKLDKLNGEGKFAYVSKIKYLDCREIDTRGVTNLRAYFGNSSFETIDISDWDFSSVTNFSYSFTNSKIKTIIWPESTDLKKVQDFTRMFASTSLLESLDLSSWTLRDAKDMSNMFDGSNINSITFGNGFNTSNVQNMTGMFNSTKISSIDVSRFNTSNVQNMSSMFANMTSLTEIDLSNFNSENLSNMQSMFSGDKNLTAITFGNNFTAEKVQNMDSTFLNCSKLETLDLSRFHAIALSTMRYTFGGCKALTNINFGNNFDGRNITTMDYAFISDSSLTKLDFSSFNTQSLSSIDYMAADASNLEILIFGSNFKTSGITDEWLESPFRGVNKLKKIYSGIDFDLSNETSGIELFPSNPDLVGGQGTTYDSSYGREYYRIDDPDNGKPGLFTDIADKPVEP